MIAFGAYILELRNLRGYTQKQVAEVAKVTDTSVRTWEQGSHEPSASSMVAILKFLGGAWEDAVSLLSPAVTEQSAGRDLALWRYNAAALTEEEQRLMSQISGLTGERRQTAILMVRQLLAAEEQSGPH